MLRLTVLNPAVLGVTLPKKLVVTLPKNVLCSCKVALYSKIKYVMKPTASKMPYATSESLAVACRMFVYVSLCGLLTARFKVFVIFILRKVKMLKSTGNPIPPRMIRMAIVQCSG